MVEVALERYLPGLMTGWSPPDLPLVLGSSLINHRIAGVDVDGVMWIMSVLMVGVRLVGVFVLFLGLFSQFRGLRCGASFWLSSHLMLCTWELTIWVWFVIFGVC